MLPNFLIIGAQKSGTTFIHKCAREHPDVFLPFNEIRFFENPEYEQSDLKQFETLFDQVSREKAVGLKRADYLSKAECPERIYQHLPRAKMILILRNPVERAVSAYFHQIKLGFLPVKPAEEGLPKIIRGDYKTLYPKSDEIIEYGFYHRHLTRYLRYFDPEQFCVVLFDAMKADPLGLMKRIYNFIGVYDQYVPKSLQLKGEHNSGVYSLGRLKLLTLRNRFVYTYNCTRTKVTQKHVNPWSRAISKTVSLMDRLLLERLYGNPKPYLSSELTEALYELYEDDINDLEMLIGQNLGKWRSLPQKPTRPEFVSTTLLPNVE
jgi:hypothetical protein